MKYRISRSRETIEEARFSLDNDRYRNAINRIYYSIYYIVSALALKNDISIVKNKPLMIWFFKDFVKDRIVPIKLSKIYKNAFKDCQNSDYKDFYEYNKEYIELKFNDMLEFVNEIEKLINN